MLTFIEQNKVLNVNIPRRKKLGSGWDKLEREQIYLLRAK